MLKIVKIDGHKRKESNLKTNRDLRPCCSQTCKPDPVLRLPGAIIIYLGLTLLSGSIDLPFLALSEEISNGSPVAKGGQDVFGLSTPGVYLCLRSRHWSGGPLPHLFTLACAQRAIGGIFCGTFRNPLLARRAPSS